jgi:hypothetical protein
MWFFLFLFVITNDTAFCSPHNTDLYGYLFSVIVIIVLHSYINIHHYVVSIATYRPRSACWALDLLLLLLLSHRRHHYSSLVAVSSAQHLTTACCFKTFLAARESISLAVYDLRHDGQVKKEQAEYQPK